MKILIAGASGVIGVNVIPLLIKQGHEVAGITRSPEKTELLKEIGCIPILCDVFDLLELKREIQSFKPDIIINQLTDLPDDPRLIPEYGVRTSRARTEGTANLIAANKPIKAKIISQSVAWEIPGNVKQLEKLTLDESGIVLRYGQIYGPGTYYENSKPKPPRVSIDVVVQATVDSLNKPSGAYEVTDGAIF